MTVKETTRVHRGPRQHGPDRLPATLPAFLLIPLLASGSEAAPRAEGIQAPPGFVVEVFADQVPGARMLAVGPDGQVYLSQTREGRVVRLPDRNGDGMAETPEIIADGLDAPHGLAFHGRDLYIAETSRVDRVSIPGAGSAGESLRTVVPDLPADGGHYTRTIVIDPSNHYLFVSVGSSCNVCVEQDPRRAAVLRFSLDGSGQTIFARGLRNAVGLAFRPGSSELWATENGRDYLGDNLPPEEIVDILVPGGDYGWPFCYGDRVADPQFGSRERCAGTIPPALTDTAHVAPLGCAFYTGSQFPQDFQGDFFLACHGSWNRSVPSGYKVLRVEVKDGRPVRAVTFLSGFRRGGRVFGRPVDVLVAPDGSLLVSDDYAGAVYRVLYSPARRR